jgi:hypothetical protein
VAAAPSKQPFGVQCQPRRKWQSSVAIRKRVNMLTKLANFEKLPQPSGSLAGTGHIHPAFMFGRVSIEDPANDVRTDTYRRGSSLCNAVALVAGMPSGNPAA